MLHGIVHVHAYTSSSHYAVVLPHQATAGDRCETVLAALLCRQRLLRQASVHYNSLTSMHLHLEPDLVPDTCLHFGSLKTLKLIRTSHLKQCLHDAQAACTRQPEVC